MQFSEFYTATYEQGSHDYESYTRKDGHCTFAELKRLERDEKGEDE